MLITWRPSVASSRKTISPRKSIPAAPKARVCIIAFDIQRDGSISNVHIETRSGSPTLDTAAIRALQRIDSFGPLPEGDHITIEDKFDYKHQ